MLQKAVTAACFVPSICKSLTTYSAVQDFPRNNLLHKNIILIVISAMDLPSLSITSSASFDKEKYIEAVINIYFNRPVAIESAIEVHAFPDLAFYVLNLLKRSLLSHQFHLLIIKG